MLRAAGATLPWQFRVYALAARVPRVLYQLPCNCRCDRALGHASLQSCFSGTHGMECSTCALEGVYAYRMTRLGKTPAQIRAGIAAHEYETIDCRTSVITMARSSPSEKGRFRASATSWTPGHSKTSR